MHNLCLLLYLSLLQCFGDAWVTITRDQKDYRKVLVGTCGDSHTTSSLRYCTCTEDHNTMMSLRNSTYYCSSPFELKCYLSLLKSKQTYLITDGKETKQILTSDPKKIDPSVYQVFIWNLRSGDTGDWYDITKEAMRYFRVMKNETTSLSNLTTVNLDVDTWKGQLIKINFGVKGKYYQPCLTLKVKGTIDYPFNLDAFKEKITPHMSTEPPTGGPKTATASPKTSAMTESAAEPETHVSFLKQNKKFVIAVPLLGVLLVVLIVVGIVLKRRKKNKSVELELGQGNGNKSTTGSYPTVDIVKKIEENAAK